MMKAVLAIVLLGVAYTGAQSFQCPHDHGFYPHEIACDQYWACDAGIPALKTCGNGLAFSDTDPKFLKENCDYYHNVDCSTRPERQPAIVTPNCPYLYGIFDDATDCSVFWNCWGGESSRYQCAPGLAYDKIARICTWIDKVPECQEQLARDTQAFICPASGSVALPGTFSRHAHPEDCREYYVCFDTVPRKYGCPIGTVFQIGSIDGFGQCASPDLVPGCEDYYGDLDLNALKQINLIHNVGAPTPTVTASKRPSRARTPHVQAVVEAVDSPRPLN